MKKVVLAAVATGLIWLAGSTAPLLGDTPDRVVAIVGKEVVLKSEIDEREMMTKLQFPETKKEPGLRKKLFDGIVDQKIILTKAKIDSVSVDESAIDGASDERFTALRSRFATNSEMEARFGKSLTKIKQEIRDESKNQQMIDGLVRKKLKNISVTYDETLEFYRTSKDRLPEAPDGISVAQILMYPMVSEAARTEAMDKIKELQARLKSGEDFAALARSSSNDPGSAPIGGDLGYIQRGEMIQSFEDSAFSLKPGQISGIVETRFGYHLIQLLDKEDRTVHVRHILAAFDRSRTDPARTLEQLRSIRADILSGKATFADMAKKYSDDQASARIGGLLQSGGTGKSVFAPDALRPELRTIIATLKNAGDISQPTRLAPPKGGEPFFAIFKLVDRIPAHRMNPEKDYAALEELALDAKKQQIYTAWIQSLKKEVLVKILSDI